MPAEVTALEYMRWAIDRKPDLSTAKVRQDTSRCAIALSGAGSTRNLRDRI
jgi:hypothetical protein